MMRSAKKRSLPARLLGWLVKLCLAVAIVVVGINIYVIKSTEDDVAASLTSSTDTVSAEEEAALQEIDPECIMVLGASVNNKTGEPSKMLRDRLDLGIELYNKGVAPKLLFSGDNGQVAYNEVDIMKKYAVEAGVPAEDIFLDHAGFSTYESVYRAQSIFQINRMVVVTQGYHLYRALYGCKRTGIEALGAASDQKTYRGQEMREIREVLARDKDFAMWIVKPEPTYMGETIPISGSGLETQ